MGKINIEGLEGIDDPCYRYQMEKLDVLPQKNKTVIRNLEAIGKDLRRDPELIVEYMKKKMSMNLIYKNGLLTTSAKLTYSEFHKVLKNFIEEIVLCSSPACKLPEIDLTLKGNKLEGNCNACSNVISYDDIIDDKILKGFIKVLYKIQASGKKLKKSEFD